MASEVLKTNKLSKEENMVLRLTEECSMPIHEIIGWLSKEGERNPETVCKAVYQLFFKLYSEYQEIIFE